MHMNTLSVEHASSKFIHQIEKHLKRMIKRLTQLTLLGIALFTFNTQAGVTVVPAAPKVSASSYILMDFDSGQILASDNIDEQLPPASLTKIMTVYVTAHELEAGRISLEDEITVSEKAWKMEGSRMFIEVNKKVKVADLLKGIIVQSGNDASVAMAEHISGTEEVFAQLMNQHAKRIGMSSSMFANSTGLPADNHFTTARDLALLARTLIAEFPEIYELHSIREFTFNDIKQSNRNNLLWRDPSVDGIKTGHTEAAGFCLVASAKREDMRLISVVMGTGGSEARIKASQSLLNYGFRFFETHKLYEANQVITSAKVWKGETESVDLGIRETLYITIPATRYKDLKAEVTPDGQLNAPINTGEQRGTLSVSLDDKEIVSMPVVTLNAVKAGSFFKQIKDEIQLLIQ